MKQRLQYKIPTVSDSKEQASEEVPLESVPPVEAVNTIASEPPPFEDLPSHVEQNDSQTGANDVEMVDKVPHTKAVSSLVICLLCM